MQARKTKMGQETNTPWNLKLMDKVNIFDSLVCFEIYFIFYDSYITRVIFWPVIHVSPILLTAMYSVYWGPAQEPLYQIPGQENILKIKCFFPLISFPVMTEVGGFHLLLNWFKGYYK